MTRAAASTDGFAAAPTTSSSPVLELRDIRQVYGEGEAAVHAIRGIDLEVTRGDYVAIMGPSGSGKSTLMNLLGCLDIASSGQYLLGGIDVSSLDDRALAKVRNEQIGFVFQSFNLIPRMTALSNVELPLIYGGVKRAERRQLAREALELVGLADRVDHLPQALSGGQQQRVGVARALAADPPLMLMDEPFSAVDPVVREQLQNEFLRLQGELGKTIVFVTHDIDEAIKLGDQVAVLRVGGTLAQLATPAELLSRPADAFVAGFVGRDRGYRALGFAMAGALPLRREPVLRLGDSLAASRDTALDGWALVVDAHDHPQGWLAVGGLSDAALAGEVTPELLNLGGTLATESGTLREALDGALSAPSGRGVVVHEDGSFAGTITASEVLARIESRAAAIRHETAERAP